MVYALDTNIIIHYLRRDPNVTHKLNDAILRGDDLVVPKIVNYELRRGFRIASAPNKEAAYSTLIEPAGCCDIAQMDDDSWEQAEKVYTDLHRKRLTVGELDILIAAYCIEYSCTLVTNNTKHFSVIDGLLIEDWTMADNNEEI